jgi:hypothetical protein
MSDNNERKPRLHIHLGGLVILIIIILILFKIDIKSKIESPRFQKNYSYIEVQIKNVWQNYIVKPIKSKTVDLFVNYGNKELEKIKDNLNKNILEVENSNDILN